MIDKKPTLLESVIVFCISVLIGMLILSGLTRKEIDEIIRIIQDNIENAR